MRIGIPKALLYHKYGRLWTTFFEELGVKVITSGEGTKETFDRGCRHCLDDICLPIKAYFGHVIELKDKVDRLFIPRVISVEKREKKRSFTCPKIIGLADMIKSTIAGLPEIIDPRIDVNNEREFLAFLKTGLRINRNPIKVIRAYRSARAAQESFEKEKAGRKKEGGMKIGVISHSYNLCGAYPTPDVEKIIKKLGAVPMTIDVYPKGKKLDEAERQFPELSWNYEREMLGGAVEMMNDEDVSGCIVVSNFSCGPDSLTSDYITRLAKRRSSIPFAQLLIDEHTGEAGLKTRIEAFLDMIRMKK
jgi:predicted nucleotide-binding protein (sugar kinase/HSP70/actin superfamily)